MDIQNIEKQFNFRFKFKPITHNNWYETIVEFTDTNDGMIYKIEMLTAISLETILENIIKDKRDNKITNVLS